MIIDIHSHIIPSVDDGAKSLDESLALLKMLKAQGVDSVVATPHFNETDTDIQSYKKKISDGFSKIGAFDNIPEVFLGCEFRYFRGISNSGLAEQFCLGNSNYILVELPYADISLSALQEIEKLHYNNGLRPILAHIDRYVSFKNYNELISFLQNSDVLAQINANSVYCEKHKRNAIKLMNMGIVNFVGSDTHSVNHRPPNMDKFFEVGKRKFPNALRAILHNNEVLYKAMKGC